MGLLANICYSAIDAGFTYMMRPFLDKGFISIDMAFVTKIPLIVLVGISIRGLVSALGSYSMTWVARSVVNVLRQRVFAHMEDVAAKGGKRPSGASGAQKKARRRGDALSVSDF